MDEYFEWLCEMVELNTKHTDHTLLITKLFRTPYVLITGIEVDAVRIRKAKELRNEGCDHDISLPISCLEVMVSIAIEAEDKIMRDSNLGNRTAEWFWLMIENLGLDQYSDENFSKYDVEEILTKFVNRDYHKNGKGSIAFTRRSKKDFRKLDIWQQFNIYLTENYISA